MLSNSFYSSQKCTLKFFFLISFCKIILFDSNFFTLLLFLIWLGSLFEKYVTLSAIKSNCLTGLVFEISDRPSSRLMPKMECCRARGHFGSQGTMIPLRSLVGHHPRPTGNLFCCGSYSFAEMLSAYFTNPAGRAVSKYTRQLQSKIYFSRFTLLDFWFIKRYRGFS